MVIDDGGAVAYLGVSRSIEYVVERASHNIDVTIDVIGVIDDSV